jgi:hypothetical protein
VRINWVKGAELPPLAFTWTDATGALIPFASVPHTFTFKLAAGSTTVLTVSTGFTPADTDPNLTLAFTAATFDAVEAGVYTGQIWARRTAGTLDRLPLEFLFTLAPAIT